MRLHACEKVKALRLKEYKRDGATQVVHAELTGPTSSSKGCTYCTRLLYFPIGCTTGILPCKFAYYAL